jgi:hypothetical protein
VKAFSLFVKYVIIPGSSVLGCLYGFDTYIIGRAGTVVEPVKVKVDIVYENNKTHQERIERELLMLRSDSAEMKNLLRKMK